MATVVRRQGLTAEYPTFRTRIVKDSQEVRVRCSGPLTVRAVARLTSAWGCGDCRLLNGTLLLILSDAWEDDVLALRAEV